jgi:hypothetical protein
MYICLDIHVFVYVYILDPVDEDLFSLPKMAILAPKLATEVR